MITRIGDTLYALGCMLAVAILLAQGAASEWAIIDDGRAGERWLATVILASSICLIGRACRYVLAGR